MQGQALRDSAEQLAQLDCVVLGASFDSVEENRAFAEAQGFGFSLLSDRDRSVGALYGVVRHPGHRFAEYPERFSYLIDPAGVVRRSYDVADVASHAAKVIADLSELQSGNG